MEEPRSLIAYEHWREASARFDYLVLGFIGAVTAYVGQSIRPARLALAIDGNNLELLALGLLVAAVVAGFKRVETNVELFRHSTRLLESLEGRAAMFQVMLKPSSVAFNTGTGNPVTPEQAAARYPELGEQAREIEALLGRIVVRSLRAYKWRNRLFAAGFAALVAARIVAAYA